MKMFRKILIVLLFTQLALADEPFVYDNGLSSWNTTNSTFGRWAYRAFRIRRTPDGKFLAEFNKNEPLRPAETNVVPDWVVASTEPRKTPELVESDLRISLMIDKGIADGFEHADFSSWHEGWTNSSITNKTERK